MIFCKALNKEFVSKEELFKELKANLEVIYDAKKAEVQYSVDKGMAVSCKSINSIKGLNADNVKMEIDENYYYIAVNTTNILDSHDDLHVDGIWSKSVQEQQFKNYLTTDHKLDMDKIAARKAYVEMSIEKMSFASLGYPYEGNTQVLIYKVPKNKIVNATAKEWLESGDEIEASVRMQYISLDFAMDSNDPDDKREKKNYDDYIDTIANKSDFEYIPYFFIIKEAKNVRESSLLVAGSNHVTGNIIQRKTNEPVKNTQEEKEIDPTDVSHKLKSSLLLT